MRVPTRQWVWGTSAHWQLYYTLKGFSKKWFSNVIQEIRVLNAAPNKRNFEEENHSPQHFKRRKSFDFSKCRRRSSTSFDSVLNDSLTDTDVNEIIQSNQQSISFQKDIVSSCETNQLASNKPNEDTTFITESLHDDGLLFGVLDGHGGSKFAEFAKERLPCYLHTALCNKSLVAHSGVESAKMLYRDALLSLPSNSNIQQPKDAFWVNRVNSRLNLLAKDTIINNGAGNIMSYVPNSLRNMFPRHSFWPESEENIDIGEAISDAFRKFDEDMIDEFKMLAKSNSLNSCKLSASLSGCCALVAYILNKELFVANLGDCRAVLGSNINGEWSAIQLTNDHTAAANPEEVTRILSEHPREETRSCIQYGRLLGRLAPLRALGDIQFKLTGTELSEIFKVLPNFSPMQSLRTPPYLSAEPEVFQYKLEKNDRFIVLASDGLWDMLSNEEVVTLVGAYLEGKNIDTLKEHAHMYGVVNCDEILSDPEAFSDTANENVASFLIRFALAGYDRNNIRSLLSLPYPDVRLYRDDISVSVIMLNP